MKGKSRTFVSIAAFAFGAAVVCLFLPEDFWNGAYSPAYFRIVYEPWGIIYFLICIGLLRLGIPADPISNSSPHDPFWRLPLLDAIGFVSAFIVFFVYGALAVLIFRLIKIVIKAFKSDSGRPK